MHCTSSPHCIHAYGQTEGVARGGGARVASDTVTTSRQITFARSGTEGAGSAAEVLLGDGPTGAERVLERERQEYQHAVAVVIVQMEGRGC